MKFTFKTDQPTGRYRSFFKPIHRIKLKGADVGTITHEHPHKIRFMVIKDDIMEDGNPNCVWRWKSLTKKFDSIDEAKLFLKRNTEQILNKINIYIQED